MKEFSLAWAGPGLTCMLLITWPRCLQGRGTQSWEQNVDHLNTEYNRGIKYLQEVLYEFELLYLGNLHETVDKLLVIQQDRGLVRMSQ